MNFARFDESGLNRILGVVLKISLAAAGGGALLLAPVAFAEESTATVEAAPVTQDQFKRSIKVLKRTIERLNALEKKTAGSAPSDDGAVDLSGTEPGKPPVGTSSTKSPHQSIGVAPNFKVFFDLNLVSRPGSGHDLSFENYHAFLFYEIAPDSKIQFSFDVSTAPKFYELDYQLTEKMQLRAGKIWIPFDDMAPHNIFGGRVNVSKLAPQGRTFLPDIWADLGIGMKYQLVDTTALNLFSQIYMVNGFGSGGTDPSGNGAAYPQFGSSGGGADNNRDKALGGRLHALFNGKLGLGISYYTGRWNDQDQQQGQSISLLGLDAQLRLEPVELRAGLASGSVGIPVDSLGNTSFKRGGMYGEIGYKFGQDTSWKVLGRAGRLQLDDRVVSVNDQTLIGATILKRVGPLEVSLEHSRDVKDVPGKTEKQYTNLRLVVAL